MDTLVSLAGRFPLPGLVRDLHPLDDTHAGQTRSPKPDFTGLRTDLLCSFEFYRTAIIGIIGLSRKNTGIE